MRGKARRPMIATTLSRITPACAGKRVRGIPQTYNTRDHPRMCGEKCCPLVCTIWLIGSPPRMRGKAGPEGQHHQPAGITPACAGKSPAMSPGHITLRDHPRMCGEKKNANPREITIVGSPPHVRGKGTRVVHDRNGRGITPACAGKSRLCACGCLQMRDHPRMCGEKVSTKKILNSYLGSPPHVRGKADSAETSL